MRARDRTHIYNMQIQPNNIPRDVYIYNVIYKKGGNKKTCYKNKNRICSYVRSRVFGRSGIKTERMGRVKMFNSLTASESLQEEEQDSSRRGRVELSSIHLLVVFTLLLL